MKTMKRIIPILFTVLMLATVFSVAVSAESLAEVPEGYIGIYTKDDLYDVRLDMSGKYIMMNDIVFDDADYAEGGDFYNVGKGWEPIGTEATPFKGIFDGNGYDIVNLQINNPDGDYQGLFGYAKSATIKQVTLAYSNIIGNQNIGGIIGYTYQCQVISCCNAATVTGNHFVGGIAGRDNSENNGNAYYFSKCVNTGNIYAKTGIASGLVGHGFYTIVRDCMNTGNVFAKSEAAGILRYGKTIARCYSIGHIYGEKASAPIGSVSSSYPEDNLVFLYYLDTSVEDFTSKYTTPKSADQLRKQGTFEQWDFENTWEMCTEDYYDFPVPQGTKFLYPHVSISGNAVYGETVTASLEYVVENVDLYKYEWTVDGNTVSTEKTYTITKEDIGKTISVKAYLEDATDEAMVSKEYVITKAEQTGAPVPATLAGKADTSFSVNVTAGQEYSTDNENWNTTGEFTSLAPNKTYTVYTRIAETDTHFAGETVDSSLTVTTDKSVIAGEVSITGDAQYSKTLSADVSLVVPEGVTYKYEWRCGEKVLCTDAEYTLTSSDIGTKICLALVADGDYTGEIKSSEIEVKAFNIANVTADAVADVQYTTKEITPEVTLFNGSSLLEKDVDYTLSYEKNITAGKAKITVTGIGDYTGTKTVEFNIIPRNLSGVTFVAVTPQKYTGYEITPAVTLKFGNYTLVENVDYTVSYSNNTSVGTAEILIEGKGNFASQITKSFAIIKTSLSSAEIIFFETEFKYNGEEITPEIFVMLGSENLTVNKDYTVSYKNNILEGTATVTITGIGGYSGSASAEFEIIGHLYGDWIERTAATCTEKGIDYRVCPGCNGEDTREVDKLGHDFSDEWTVDTEETCAEEGSKSHHCLRCSEISDVTVIPATGNHDYASAITTPATCKQAGVRTYTCTVCSDTYTEPVEIDSTNHVGGTEIRGAYAEDCGNNGYTGDTHCLGCDTKLADGTSIPATGNHDYISVITTPATCKQAGVRTYTCTVCSDSYTEPVEIDSTNHVGGTEIRGAYAEDCGNNGYTGDTYCLGCDTKLADGTSIPATGNHDYISVITTPATCKQAGVRTYTCTVCSDTYVEETPALGHTEEVISGKSATCTETGLTEGKKCSVCNEILVAQFEISALGHKEEVISGKPATCTESGISDGIKCSVCGETLVAQEEIPALGHTIERIEGRFPTCTEPGLSYGEKCSVCGIIITEQTETEPWGHEETTLRGFLMPTTSSEGYSGDTICVLCSEVVKKGSVIPVKQTPVIEVSPVEGNVGDTVSVVVSGKNVIGLESFAFVFEYDETVLEFVNIGTAENAERLIGMGGKPENTTNAITFSGFWLNSHGDMCISSDSDLAVITFKIIGEGDRTVSPALNNGEWSDYYDMPPELENYCFHETEIQGFVLPSYETGGYSGDKVCIKCKEVFEYGKELPVKKQPSFEFSSTDAKVGDTVTITVNLKDSVSFSSGYLELTYDAEYLKYVDVQSNDKQLLIGMSNDETEGKVGLLLFATFSQPYTYSDTSFDLQFVVLKDGSSEMTMIQDDDWSDEFGIPPSPATYTFTTACEHVEEVIPAKSATCTAKGATEGKKCSVCGEILVAQEEIPALGHKEEVISGKSATCTETGLTEGKKCSVCGEILVAQSEIPALGHTEEVISGKSATCTETGLTEGKKCSVCGEILAEQEEIPATGHAYGEWTVVKNPTITEEGSEERTCASCGKAETRTIEKLNYLAGDINRDVKITAADARLALRIAAKLDNATEYQAIVADMNQDKKITAADARKILRISAKLE